MSEHLSFSKFSAETITDGGEVLYGLIVCEKGIVPNRIPIIGSDKKKALEIDDAFLDSLVELGKAGPVKLRVNHPYEKGDVLSIIAEGKNLRRSTTGDGKDCVRCDGYIFDTEDPDSKKIIKLAHKAAHLFGMSIDAQIKVVKELKNAVCLAVCTALNAIDFVDTPAAASALFGKTVDSNSKREKERTMTKQELEAQIAALNTQLETLRAEGGEKKEKDEGEKMGYEKLCKMMAEMGARLDKFEAFKAKMEKDDGEGDEEEKKKKVEAERLAAEKAKGDLHLTQEQLDTAIARVTMQTLEKVGLKGGKGGSNPDGDDGGNKGRQLSALELKMAKSIGITDEKGLAQYAANLEHAEKAGVNVKL